MSRFNLLEEPWISVISDERGHTKEVSLIEFFENAHLYKDFAGETRTQDFAVMRVLLAVLHTVFSRVDASGVPYDYFEIDEKYRQVTAIDKEDVEDYKEDLYQTWFDLWQGQQFPSVLTAYLKKWKERFYLFDESYPFFQVTKGDISAEKLNKSSASSLSGKNINRTISESGNKTALFSPKYEKGSNKEILSEKEIVRWLITFQSYTGLSDKVIFGTEKYKASKGWLYDLGGVYFKGSTLFETLLYNCILVHEDGDNLLHKQCPCWEVEPEVFIQQTFRKSYPDNLATLYTAWSRALYIDSDCDVTKPFSCEIVKLPDITHTDQFLEVMTLWRYNDAGENKNKYTPRKHQANKAVWRSFGLIAGVETSEKGESITTVRKPGIIEWHSRIKETASRIGFQFDNLESMLCAVSMQDDGNATSWVPTDEIIDHLWIDELVLADMSEDSWLIRINDTVEETKKAVGVTYKRFISDLKEIRNISSEVFVPQKVEALYFQIDVPFRQWLASIGINDQKDEKILEWRKTLKNLIKAQIKEVVDTAGARDYIGIETEKGIKNIATIYNSCLYFLDKELSEEGKYGKS